MTHSTRPPFVLAATGALYALLALVFCAGGALLLWRDGSGYYLIAGVGLLLCAGLVWRGHRAALSVSAALLLGSLAWSVWEVQLDWGQLLPRVDVWFVLAAWLLVPVVGRHLGAAESHGGKLLWAALAVSALVGLFSLSRDYHTLDGELPTRGVQRTLASSAWTSPSMLPVLTMTPANWVW